MSVLEQQRVLAPMPVLMYHAVGSTMPPGLEDLSVPPSLLGEQLRALQEDGYELLGMSGALAAQQEGRRVAALTFDDGYDDFLDRAVGVLTDADARATLYVPSRALGGPPTWLPPAEPELRLLSSRAVADTAALGVEIGSHGARHVPMDVLPAAAARAHLHESREVLEEVVRRPVTSFCYPHGYHSPRLRRLVRTAGYDNACAIGHRLHPADSDPFAVQRLMVGPAHDPEALLALVRSGPGALGPALKRAATPAWRVTRRLARRAGVTWT